MTVATDDVMLPSGPSKAEFLLDIVLVFKYVSFSAIINVAVSRAKQNLYVVGSATAWAGAGTSLQVLHRQLAQSS